MRLRRPCEHDQYDDHAVFNEEFTRHEDGVPVRVIPVASCPGGEFLTDRFLYWVKNADPEGDLGDYSGYQQSDWDEAVGVAGELVSDGHWHDGIEAAEVLELVVVRSLIVKATADETEDEE